MTGKEMVKDRILQKKIFQTIVQIVSICTCTHEISKKREYNDFNFIIFTNIYTFKN